jgi:hypothetical protein
MSGPEFEILQEWCTLSNLASVDYCRGFNEVASWILIEQLRASYRRLSFIFPDLFLSQCFDRVDARLKVIEGAIRLLQKE